MALLGPGHPGWIALSASGRAAVLTSPTSRYPHGVVGDEIEAASLTIPMPDGQVEGIAVIAEPVVIEGISPMRADLDGDGVEEVIVTLSDDDVGARIAGYHTDGTLAAEGPPIGLGSRWRHEIGAAPHRTRRWHGGDGGADSAHRWDRRVLSDGR